jgi:hypothetical protein
VGSQSERGKYSKSGRRPTDIPANPRSVYKKHWKGWGDWLGTGVIAPRNRQYRSFERATEFAHSLSLKSKEEWYNYCLSGRKPSDIPQKPERVYENEWKWWADWLWLTYLIARLCPGQCSISAIYNNLSKEMIRLNEEVAYS